MLWPHAMNGNGCLCVGEVFAGLEESSDLIPRPFLNHLTATWTDCDVWQLLQLGLNASFNWDITEHQVQ